MNKNIEYVNPFKRMCITIGILPTAYIESMSYYECLTYLVNYLSNNVIPAVNNNGEVVDELQQKYVELKQYVDDYFTNLDVQTEINNKLDDMAEQGELTAIILEYLQLGGLIMFNTLADMKAGENLIDGCFVQTSGELSYDDGKRELFKIRELTESDTIDEITLFALSNYPTLVAEKLDYYRLDQIDSTLSSMTDGIDDISDHVGNIANLTTTDKTNVVSAINEINDTKIGDLADLTTTDKSSVVNAINQLLPKQDLDLSVSYHAYRTTSDSNTPQITVGKFVPSTGTFTTTSSGISNVYCNVHGLTNSKGSIGKIYGPVHMTVNYTVSASNGYPCIRLRCSDYGIAVPQEDYSIWSAGICYLQNDVSCSSIYISSDGYIYLYGNLNKTASNDEYRLIYNPCIYIWSDLGDDNQ